VEKHAIMRFGKDRHKEGIALIGVVKGHLVAQRGLACAGTPYNQTGGPFQQSTLKDPIEPGNTGGHPSWGPLSR
jgi:hypothetical protein